MNRAWIAIAGSLVVVLIVAVLSPGEPSKDAARGSSLTTYSAGPSGAKAFFLLLGDLGVDVSRRRRPDYASVETGSVLWSLRGERLSDSEQRQLMRFIARGGTVVSSPQLGARLFDVAGAQAKVAWTEGDATAASGVRIDADRGGYVVRNLKAEQVFASSGRSEAMIASYRIGHGRLVVLGTPSMVENRFVGRSQNGPLLVRIAFALGSHHVFDEYAAGFGDTSMTGLISRMPYRYAFVQFGVVGIVCLFILGIRTTPAESTGIGRRRHARDHIDAVAQLWLGARDPGLPLEAILFAMDEQARLRLGGDGGSLPFVDWVSRARPDLAVRAQTAWEAARNIAATGAKTTVEGARRAAASLKEIEEEASRWSSK